MVAQVVSMLSTYSAYLQCCKRPQDGEQGYWQTCTNIIKYDKQKASQGLILIFRSTAIRQSNPAPLSTQSARSPWTKGGTTGHEERRSRRSRRSYKCFSLDCMATHGYALLYSKTIISKFGACWFHIDFSHISLPAATQPMPKKGTGTNSNSSGHWKPIPKPFKIKSVADQSFQHLDFQFFLLFPHLLADASSFLSGKHGLFQQVPGTASWLWNMWRCLGYPPVNIQKTMENHHFLWVNQLFLWPFSIAMLNY